MANINKTEFWQKIMTTIVCITVISKRGHNQEQITYVLGTAFVAALLQCTHYLSDSFNFQIILCFFLCIKLYLFF